jgi:2-oxoglutarate dehydrogenase E1 component
VTYDYVGRELRASPGEGYPVAHRREQERIVRVALGDTSLYRDASFTGGLGSA